MADRGVMGYRRRHRSIEKFCNMKGWTLVFDLDGTLVDSAPDLAAATNHVLASLGLTPVDERDIRPFVGHGALVMIEKAAAAHGRVLTGPDLYKQFDVFIEHYVAHIADASRPYDGVIAALETARAGGATLAVCTNKLESHAHALLGALGMSDYFAAVTGRDSLGVWKPDPGHLTGTIARAGGDIRRAILIGDTETDIATAKAAAAPVIAVDFGYSTESVASFAPDAVISRYAELIPAVERIARCAAVARQ
ncbi:MAG: HAD hydrolase-like protein [Hyphomicrobium sp.]